MPAGKKDGQSRKSCDEAHAALENLGGMTIENLAKLDHKLRNKCFAAYRDYRNSDDMLKETYDNAADDAARRSMCLAFIIDAKAGKLAGKNTTKVSRKKENVLREVWLTYGQLCGPHPGLNDKDDAKAFTNGAKSRPHKTNAGLRRAGIKEYQHFVEWEDKSKAEEETQEVTNDATMEAEEYMQVRRDMSSSMEGSSAAVRILEDSREAAADQKAEDQGRGNKQTARKGKAPPANESAGDGIKNKAKALAEAKKALDEKMTALKSLHNRIIRELGEVGIIKKNMAQRTNWGPGPLTFLETETQKWVEKAGELLDYWVDVTAWKKDNHTGAEFKKKAEDVMKHKDRVDLSYKETYVNAVLSPFASLKK